MSVLFGKKILLGVTAGVAIYKSLELIRLLKKAGAQVRVAMTRQACKLISEQLFEVVSEEPVSVEMFGMGIGLVHIDLARWADVIVVCPATADFLSRAAFGRADDVLTTMLLASPAPKLICPAMNDLMWENSLVQENVKRLKNHGYEILMPNFGKMACGSCGVGRLEELDYIMFRIEKVLTPQNLAGKKILISAGSTREKIDPVRFISNFSSGKMGYELAKTAALKGAKVFLVSGPVALPKPIDVELISVETADEMFQAVMKYIKDVDIFVSAAAVLDFRPRKIFAKKIKKGGLKNGSFNLELIANPDILRKTAFKKAGLKKSLFRVGFALETEALLKNAQRKLKGKDLDMIIANSPANLGADEKKIAILKKSGEVSNYRGKVRDVADKIWEEIVEK